jgi:hypothetical protein
MINCDANAVQRDHEIHALWSAPLLFSDRIAST